MNFCHFLLPTFHIKLNLAHPKGNLPSTAVRRSPSPHRGGLCSSRLPFLSWEACDLSYFYSPKKFLLVVFLLGFRQRKSRVRGVPCSYSYTIRCMPLRACSSHRSLNQFIQSVSSPHRRRRGSCHR